MAITFPRANVLSAVKFSADGYSFALQYRQEQSRAASGITYVKDFGDPLWRMRATTVPLAVNDALDYEALLETLGGGLQQFLGWDLRRAFPRSAPTGSFSDTASVSSLNFSNGTVAIKGLPAGFVVSRGDYLSVVVNDRPALLQASETVTASGSGITSSFVVSPGLPVGISVNDPIRFKRASTIMTIIPGSIQKQQVDSVLSSVSFEAMESR